MISDRHCESYYKKLIVVYNSKNWNFMSFKTRNGSFKIKKTNQYIKKEKEEYHFGWTSPFKCYTLNRDTERHVLIKIKKDETGTALTIHEIDNDIIGTTTCYVEDIFVDLK